MRLDKSRVLAVIHDGTHYYPMDFKIGNYPDFMDSRGIIYFRNVDDKDSSMNSEMFHAVREFCHESSEKGFFEVEKLEKILDKVCWEFKVRRAKEKEKSDGFS